MRRGIVFLLGVFAAAQTPTEPTFRTGTELVQVSVVALVLLPGLAPAQKKKTPSFDLVVGGLASGSRMPAVFTCDAPGGGASPPLRWSGEPAGVQSFALITIDADAQDYVHWLLWDIPGSVHSIETGAKGIGVAGANNFGDRAYGGPCPPQGAGNHTYVFRLFALDVPSVGLKAGKGRDALEQAMQKHVVAKAEYQLRYGH